MQTTHTKPELTSAPEVYIYPSAWVKLFHLLQKGLPDEISGLGKTAIVNGKIIITDIIYVGGAHQAAFTDIQKQYSDYLNELIASEQKQEIPKIHLFWHSHNTMAASWSSFDLQTIHNAFANSTYWVCLVVNANEDYQCAVIYKPKTVLNNLGIKMYYGEGDILSADEAIKQADAEYARFHQQFFRASGPEPASTVVEENVGVAETGTEHKQ